uniref:non-specific serine/threonine protein kinase n=1 Tax=Aegilops tauschii subsp. strangulata TaxID=200361 RepID=A0A452ZNN7_AEGTS
MLDWPHSLKYLTSITASTSCIMATFVSLLLLLGPLLRSCTAASAGVGHTLAAGSSLSVEDHDRPFLVSPDATFSCGFLPAGDVVDNAFYFSVWFTAATDRTAVWTANPGAPVNGRVSRVSFGDDGKLALADANGTTVWDSKNAGSKHFTVSLLDTGNLRVQDPSTGRAVWQSFDWPTDTLLPSQPLTKDTKLVAGYYTLYYDNDNVLRLVYDGPEIASIYWPDRDIGVFGSGRTNYNSSRIAVLDDTGVFLSSDNLRTEASDRGAAGVKRRLTIEQDGNVRMYSMDGQVGCGEAAVLRPRAVRQERRLRVPAVPPVLLRAGVRDGGPPGLEEGLQADLQPPHHQLQHVGKAVHVRQGGVHRFLRLRRRVQHLGHVRLLQEHLLEHVLLRRLRLQEGWHGPVLPQRGPLQRLHVAHRPRKHVSQGAYRPPQRRGTVAVHGPRLQP